MKSAETIRKPPSPGYSIRKKREEELENQKIKKTSFPSNAPVGGQLVRKKSMVSGNSQQIVSN